MEAKLPKRVDDKSRASTYDVLMGDGQTHIIVTLDTKEPIEIGDFVTAFTSVASQYEKFMTDSHPEMGGDARVYVKEVRSGSIIADLIPVLKVFGVSAPTVLVIQQADAIVDFVTKYGEKLKIYLNGDGIDVAATDSDLKEFLGSVSAIANDPDGKVETLGVGKGALAGRCKCAASTAIGRRRDPCGSASTASSLTLRRWLRREGRTSRSQSWKLS